VVEFVNIAMNVMQRWAIVNIVTDVMWLWDL